MTQTNYTKSQLAIEYGFSYSKFVKELRVMNFYEVFAASKNNSILTPKELDYIIEAIGPPPSFQQSED